MKREVLWIILMTISDPLPYFFKVLLVVLKAQIILL